MKESRVFLDANILVYAYDVSAGKKYEIAANIISDLWDSGQGIISTQVLQEFFVSITQKIPKPVELDAAKDIISDFLKWKLVVNDGDSIVEAITLQKKYRYSFWDSLIIQAAIRGGAEILFTEDLNHGQVIEGITIENPFVVK